MPKNLRTFIFTTLLVLVVLVLAAQKIKAVDSEYDAAYKEYVTAQSNYRDAHDDYILSRAQYLRFQTQQSQTDAINSTAKMLVARDDLMIKYMLALRAKVNETKGISEDKKQSISSKVDEEIGWYNDHKQRLPSGGSLNDVIKDSENAKKKFSEEMPFFFDTLSIVSAGKVVSFRERMNDEISKLKDKIDKIKSSENPDERLSVEKLQTIDRWLFESDQRLARSEEKINEANDDMNEFYNKRNDNLRKQNSLYDSVITRIEESKQYLKDTNTYLLEVVREIKTKD